MEIKKVRLFVNNNEKSQKFSEELKITLKENGFELAEDGYELAIAIGGDGAFLRMVKESNFNSDIYYIGINVGTLGFLQEVKDDEVELLIKELKDNNFKIDRIGIQETEVLHDEDSSIFYSLNEIVVRDKNLKTNKMTVKIDDDILEKSVGDGLLVATSIGSTAQNLSLGGSIIDSTFSTLQITPIAPINTSAYHSLLNSVIIPSYRKITLIPELESRNVIITIDGENSIYDNVREIKTKIRDKEIKMLRLSRYNFPQRINEKLL